MFKYGIYSFIPPLKASQVLVAIVWMLGVISLSICLRVAQAQDAEAHWAVADPPGAIVSPLPTPHPAMVDDR